MNLYLTIIATVLTLTLLAGLYRVAIGPSNADRMLGCQLFGTAGVALTILLAVLQQQPALLNLALVLALLAPLTLIVFVKSTGGSKMNIIDIYTIVMTSAGLLFFMAGTIGLLRFVDAISRLHALTKADNLGLGLIVLGIIPQVASMFDAVQLVFIWLIVMVSGAASCFLIANVDSASKNLPSTALPLKGDDNEF